MKNFNIIIVLIISIVFTSLSNAWALELDSSTIIQKGLCEFNETTTTCNFYANHLNALSGVVLKLGDEPLQGQVKLYSNRPDSKGLGVLLNLPRLSRSVTQRMRTHLIELFSTVAEPISLAAFTSAEQGLNPIGVMGVNRLVLRNRINDWQSPSAALQPVEDLLQSLKIVDGGGKQRNSVLWITSGVEISNDSIAKIKIFSSQENIRIGIVQLMQTDADLNRFSSIKKLAQETNAFYRAARFDVSSMEFSKFHKFFDNGAEVIFPSEELCGEHVIAATFAFGQDVVNKELTIGYPSCPEPEAELVPESEQIPELEPVPLPPVLNSDIQEEEVASSDDSEEVLVNEEETAEDTSEEGGFGDEQTDPEGQSEGIENQDSADTTLESQPTEQSTEEENVSETEMADNDLEGSTVEEGRLASEASTDEEGAENGEQPVVDEANENDDIAQSQEEDSSTNMVVFGAIATLCIILIGIFILMRRRVKGDTQISTETYGWLSVSESGGNMDHPLTAGVVRIGRSVGNDIVLTESSISAFHALLKKDNYGQVILTDLKSLNGTYVNGEEISDATLKHGDQIRFGSCLVTYQSAGTTND